MKKVIYFALTAIIVLSAPIVKSEDVGTKIQNTDLAKNGLTTVFTVIKAITEQTKISKFPKTVSATDPQFGAIISEAGDFIIRNSTSANTNVVEQLKAIKVGPGTKLLGASISPDEPEQSTEEAYIQTYTKIKNDYKAIILELPIFTDLQGQTTQLDKNKQKILPFIKASQVNTNKFEQQYLLNLVSENQVSVKNLLDAYKPTIEEIVTQNVNNDNKDLLNVAFNFELQVSNKATFDAQKLEIRKELLSIIKTVSNTFADNRISEMIGFTVTSTPAMPENDIVDIKNNVTDLKFFTIF